MFSSSLAADRVNLAEHPDRLGDSERQCISAAGLA
jgi:hypothetical protein